MSDEESRCSAEANPPSKMTGGLSALGVTSPPKTDQHDRLSISALFFRV